MTSLQPLWKTVWGILRKLKIELPHDPAIPLLELYPKETKTLTRKDTYTSMFVTALFTIAKTWKQPKYPSMDEWIKKLWYVYIYVYIPHTYTHTMGYYSVIKKTHTKIELPYDAADPLMGLHLKKTRIGKTQTGKHALQQYLQ